MALTVLSLGWLALGWLGLVSTAHAQAPAPAKSASAAAAAAAAERSQDPAYSVFRWIKMHADTPKKAEPAKAPAAAATTVAPPPPARPRTESTTAANPAPRPTQGAPEPGTPAPNATPGPATAAAPATAAPAALGNAPAPAATQTAAAEPETSDEPGGDLKIISQAQPEFPRELRNVIAHGKVIVSFTVQPDGTVAEPTVVSYTNRKLGKPATDAVAKWVFEPVRSARTVQVEIAFNAQ